MASGGPSEPSAPGCSRTADESLGPCWFCPFCSHRIDRLYFSSALKLNKHFKEKHGELYRDFSEKKYTTLNSCAYCGEKHYLKECVPECFNHLGIIKIFNLNENTDYEMHSLLDIVRHTVNCHPLCITRLHQKMSWLAVEIRAAHIGQRVLGKSEEERRFNAPPAECTRSKTTGKARGKRNSSR